jgi:formylmethanofuran dehydrogenase subunit B
MDIGSLVVDLVSLVIVTSVLTLALVRKGSPNSSEQRTASEDADDQGYFGPNPLEDADRHTTRGS